MVHLLTRQHAAHDGEGIAHGRKRAISSKPHALGRAGDARADAEPRAAARDLIERPDLHRHQGGMAVVGVDHP